MLSAILIYIGIGSIVGTLAGFFGIGGGVILVPSLIFSLKLANFPQEVLIHTALGTSLACIFINAISSTQTHHKNKNIYWDIFKKLFIGIFIGTILGSTLASQLSPKTLKIAFTVFLTIVFLKMLFHSNKEKQRIKLPDFIYWIVGSLIGFKSAVLGVGGGTISIPFLTWTGIPIKKAVGVSASIGLPIAFFGSLSYIYNGWAHPILPAYSLGYIYLPAFLGIISTSAIFAKLGARLSQNISANKLRVLFLVFLIIVLIKSYLSIIQ